MPKKGADSTRTCTAEEATVLSMIKAWPGVPAIVTYSREGGWAVSTSPEDVERRFNEASVA